MIVPGIGQTLALPGKLSYSFWKTGNLWKTIFWLQNAWKYKLIVLISFLFKWPWCKWDNAWRGVHNQELMDSMSFNIRRFLLKKGCNLRASADLDYSGRAVWSILMFIFWGVFFFLFSTTFNTTTLFYCEAPEMFCALPNFTWRSISMKGSDDDWTFNF